MAAYPNLKKRIERLVQRPSYICYVPDAESQKED